MSTHKKKINFATQLWDIFLNHYFEALSTPGMGDYAYLKHFNNFFYFHGYLTSIKKVTSYLNSFSIYWKLIILKYFEHTQAYLNTPNLNTKINLFSSNRKSTLYLQSFSRYILSFSVTCNLIGWQHFGPELNTRILPGFGLALQIQEIKKISFRLLIGKLNNKYFWDIKNNSFLHSFCPNMEFWEIPEI